MKPLPSATNPARIPVPRYVCGIPVRVVYLLLASLFGMAALFAYLLWSHHQDAQRSASITGRNIAGILTSRLESSLNRLDATLSELATTLPRQAMSPASAARYREQMESLLNLRHSRFPESTSLRVFDADGNLLYTSRRNADLPTANIADRDYYRQLRDHPERTRVYSDALVARFSGLPGFVVGHAIRDADGRFLGIVASLFPINQLEEVIREVDIGTNGVILVRRTDNFRLVLGWPRRSIPEDALAPGHPNRVAIEHGKRIATVHTTAQIDGVSRQFSLRRLTDHPFYVMVGVADQDQHADWRQRLEIVALAAGLVLLVILLLLRQIQQSERNLRAKIGQLAESETRFRKLFEDSAEAQLLIENDRFIDSNQAALDLFGVAEAAQIAGFSPSELSPATQPDGRDSRQKAAEVLERAFAEGSCLFEWVHRRQDDSLFTAEVLLTPILHHDRRLLLVALRDISDRKRAEARVQLLASVFEHSGEAILITDRNNRIIDVNPAFSATTGYGRDEVLGKNPRILASGRASDEDYRAMWRSILTRGTWQGELWDKHKDGHVYPKITSIFVIRDAHGEIAYHVGVFTDITERKSTEERIHHLAFHDSLTRLPNRMSLHARLEQSLAAAKRESRHLAVMFIDLDRFKVINDTLGHHIGDALLIEVAQRLRDTVRESDIVARLGGDEFVIVLSDVELDFIPGMALKVIERLGEPYALVDQVLHTTPSIGICLYPEDGDSADVLMRNADTAMYCAKGAGRNNYQFFTAAMNQAASERLVLENSLRLALQRQEFELHYQPQIEAASGRIVGVEALVRWRHPESGLIPPLKFIPIADETGLIVPLGAWVLDEALRQLAAWRAEGVAKLRMAVNLSANQLRDPLLPELIDARLRAHGLEGADLELEVTESVAMEDPKRSTDLLLALRQLGIDLSIDDFGTGYSSLAYLKQLPLDRLKLDRSFVMDIEHDPNDAAICAATISLAHSLHLAVVGEGVENQWQLDYLKNLGCDLIQGFFISRPLPAAQCLDFIRQGQVTIAEP